MAKVRTVFLIFSICSAVIDLTAGFTVETVPVTPPGTSPGTVDVSATWETEEETSSGDLDSTTTTTIIITTTVPPTPAPDPGGLSETDAIIIGVVCGVAGVVIIVVSILYIRHRRRKKRSEAEADDGSLVGHYTSREEFNTQTGLSNSPL